MYKILHVPTGMYVSYEMSSSGIAFMEHYIRLVPYCSYNPCACFADIHKANSLIDYILTTYKSNIYYNRQNISVSKNEFEIMELTDSEVNSVTNFITSSFSVF